MSMVNNDASRSRLRIAIQKSGRLTDDTEKLFKNCGIKINAIRRTLIPHCCKVSKDISPVH